MCPGYPGMQLWWSADFFGFLGLGRQYQCSNSRKRGTQNMGHAVLPARVHAKASAGVACLRLIQRISVFLLLAIVSL